MCVVYARKSYCLQMLASANSPPSRLGFAWLPRSCTTTHTGGWWLGAESAISLTSTHYQSYMVAHRLTIAVTSSSCVSPGVAVLGACARHEYLVYERNAYCQNHIYVCIFMGRALRGLQPPPKISEKRFKWRLDMKFLFLVINRLRFEKFYLEEKSQHPPKYPNTPLVETHKRPAWKF